ncbi:hypothetical protein ACJX0J_009482, partial [Zea mays]
ISNTILYIWTNIVYEIWISVLLAWDARELPKDIQTDTSTHVTRTFIIKAIMWLEAIGIDNNEQIHNVILTCAFLYMKNGPSKHPIVRSTS